MEDVQEQPRGEDAGRLWQAAAGWARISGPDAFLTEHCIIDNPNYGAGTVTWQVRASRSSPGGGTRNAGLRPLRPDTNLREVHREFYAKLKASIEERGIVVPVLFWEINGKLYTRYGASRIHCASLLGLESVPCIVSSYSHEPERFLLGGRGKPLEGPQAALGALGHVKNIGTFECSHEKLDIHNVEPW